MNLRLLSNINYMVLAQAANYALPLVLIPYLVRTIGLAEFGAFSVAQSMIGVGIILVQFGFNIYVTKDIAEKNKNGQTIDSIISTTFIFQILISLILIVGAALVNAIAPTKTSQLTFLYSFALFGQALFPVWYFQGKQRFKQLALLNFFLRLSSFLLIFIFIKKQDDLIRLPIIYSFSFLSIGLISAVIMWKNHFFHMPSTSALANLANQTKDLFFSNVVSVLLMNIPIFYMNHLSTKEEVGTFSAILRVIYALRGLINSSFQVLLPTLISEQDKLNHKGIVTKLLLLLLLICFVGLIAKEPFLTLLYGQHTALSYNGQYEVLLLSVIPGSLATLFNFVFASYYGQFKRRKHNFLRAFVVASILFYPFILVLNGLGAAMVILICDTILLILGSRIIRHAKPAQ